MTDWIPGPGRPEDDPGPRAPEPVRPDPLDLPPDVPRSPSGRVPQWVLDEAAGRPSDPVPFRAWQSDVYPAPRPRARRRGRAAVAVVALAALVGGLVWWGKGSPAPASYAVPSASSPAPSETPAPAPTPSASATPGGTTSTWAPAAGLGETPRPESLPTGDLKQPKNAAYVFVARQKDTKAGVTWSPCRPLRWVLRAAGQAPRDGDRMLRDAFDRLAEATGLEIEYLGTTKEKYADRRKAYQPNRYGRNWAPVLVSWSTVAEDPGLAGDVLGRAGPQWVVSDSGDRTYVSGSVSLDAAELGRVRASNGYEVARAVVMHELAHLAGLAHVKATSSLMYPRVQRGVTDYSEADRAGLRALGEGPCQPDV